MYLGRRITSIKSHRFWIQIEWSESIKRTGLSYNRTVNKCTPHSRSLALISLQQPFALPPYKTNMANLSHPVKKMLVTFLVFCYLVFHHDKYKATCTSLLNLILSLPEGSVCLVGCGAQLPL